ncbi:hypothetical protein AB6N23_00405 [Cellulomonas sp. 179-A 9B4 NHS]|uniref:hypothetical protein n=1 Tax=Cellulomonas sp. 179-A 9B4 NHS TaxID=3142379 RepID=UPI0039A0ACDE
MGVDGGVGRDAAPHRVVPGSARPCGCHVRLPEYRDVLCDEHAARRRERRDAERHRAEQRAQDAVRRLPWTGPGGRAFRWALVAALVTVVGAVMWRDAAAERAAFEAGYVTTTATVDRHDERFRGPDSYDVTFAVDGRTHHAALEDVDEDLRVGGDVRVDLAVADPDVVRVSGYDSAADAAAAAWLAAVAAAVTAALLGTSAAARRRSTTPSTDQGGHRPS